jgi:hypothetical protein
MELEWPVDDLTVRQKISIRFGTKEKTSESCCLEIKTSFHPCSNRLHSATPDHLESCQLGEFHRRVFIFILRF